MRRRLAALGAIALALTALAYPDASAEFRGTDVVDNVSPDSQVSDARYYDRHPLSNYALDYHVDAVETDVGLGGVDVDVSGIPALIAQFIASQLWELSKFLVNAVIDLFTWAFSLDLLQGDPRTPGDGALAPVAEAISSIHDNVFGQAWMVVGITLAGMWGIWKALVQRRYTETAGALALSVLFVLIALFFVHRPESTVGTASEWTSKMSLAFLSGANRGSVDDPERAKTQVADHLFKTLIYDPWVVLNFGGLRHCVDSDDRDDDGFPKPVSPNDPRADICRDHVRRGADGHGGYAERFLARAPGSDERDREYQALKKGEAGDVQDDLAAPALTPGSTAAPDPAQFRGYEVDKADAPAVDIQQQGGAYQRVTVALIVLLGALGAVTLLGFLSLAVILAQVLALVLLAFAPVALVIGIFPGRGHDLFRSWLAKLATAIVIKALYSLVIAIVLAVSAAIVAATGELGFLFAFGIQTLFFWAVFLYRKQISARLVAATTGEEGRERSYPRMATAYYAARLAQPVRGARHAMERRRRTVRERERTAALATSGGSQGASGGGAHGDPRGGPGSGRDGRGGGPKDGPRGGPVPAPGGGGGGTNGQARRSGGSTARATPVGANDAAGGRTGNRNGRGVEEPTGTRAGGRRRAPSWGAATGGRSHDSTAVRGREPTPRERHQATLTRVRRDERPEPQSQPVRRRKERER